MRFIALALFFTCPSILLAHDLWLLPPQTPVVGKPIVIRAHSGDQFPVSQHAPDPANFSKRSVRLPDGSTAEVEAVGTKDRSGLLRFAADRPGIYCVSVQTAPKLIRMEADKFNAYLVSDGLPHIYRLRSEEKSLDKPTVERYSKSPKLLLKIGEGKGDPCKPLDLPLEIVPLSDPFSRKVGDALIVRVLFRGKPLADANLGWDWQDMEVGERPRGTARTDAKGDALIPLARGGLFTIRLTHMTQPKAAEYEWESFWTTLTFDVPR